jgi:hypothetical protein
MTNAPPRLLSPPPMGGAPELVEVDAGDLAYLMLTARRFKCLLHLFRIATGKQAPDVVRELDQIIALLSRNRPPPGDRRAGDDRSDDEPDTDRPGDGIITEGPLV